MLDNRVALLIYQGTPVHLYVPVTGGGVYRMATD